MSDDWDVIEELELWDDYKEIYGEDPLSGKQQKKVNKAIKQNAKNQSSGCCSTTMMFMIMVMVAIPCLIIGFII